jgi:hypothetical protein
MTDPQLQLTEQDVAKSAPVTSPRNLRESLWDQRGSLETTLKTIFLTNKEEGRIHAARRIMGGEIAMLSDEELQVYLAEFQYLVAAWVDEYEKSVFNGKTIREVLQEEG